jgi:NDP-sugar pyrophosphorylase family protein
VNAGIYLFKTRDLEIIENTHYIDTPDFITLLLKSGKKGKVYSLEGPWMDVGRPSDLQEAQSKFSRGLRND